MSEVMEPLILCTENVNGVEVEVKIDPQDDFQNFLDKSKSILGYDVDLNSITRNKPVSITDNIYKFLLETQNSDGAAQNCDLTLNPDDSVYVLDDGTQIRASQIHFDNEDPVVDLTAEKIPFVKYADDVEDVETDMIAKETRRINIVESPVAHWPNEPSSPSLTFVNSLPFKLVCNKASSFEAQLNRYLEKSVARTYANLNPVPNRNKSPRTTKENAKKHDEKFSKRDDVRGYTREEVLNMFKNSPVPSASYEGNFNEKRRHVRKTDPSRAVHRGWNAKPQNYDSGILIGDNESSNCFICDKFVENNIDKLYLFDNEDQKLHRSSPQKKSSRQLKIICKGCLSENFQPSRMKGPNECLNPDEYLVIRNNQQYIFQKTNEIEFKSKKVSRENCFLSNKELAKHRQEKEKVEFVKVEIGSDGEIVTKPIDNDPRSFDDIVIVKDDGKDSSSDVEVVDTPDIDEIIVDNLDDADDQVKEFLGKYQCEDTNVQELKCRFCERIFDQLIDVMNHLDDHKHDWEEGVVYPCPICEYGYANSKWLRCHLKAAHEKKDNVIEEKGNNEDTTEDKTNATSASPIAKRTRSSTRKENSEKPEKPVEEPKETAPKEVSSVPGMIIKTEVKQEALDTSDEEIWIVQTGDETPEQLENLLQTARLSKTADKVSKKIHKCYTCSHIFPTEEILQSHKCRGRGRKRKSMMSKDDNLVCVPTKKDFIKRAQGRPKSSDISDNNDLLVPRTRRKKNKPTSDPHIVTCNDCNESFTSKVRLKFHMQFHQTTDLVDQDGRYKCCECSSSTFKTETELFDHIHFRHDKQRRWQCPVRSCGKTFHLRATLTKHSRTHTDTRRYVCVTCGKRFLDKQTLDEHGVTHLQIKPFQCHICLKQLTRRSRLRMHLRAHEEELTPKLVLVCAVCSRAFRDTEDAQEHATKSTECLEVYTRELKVESDGATAQLSPTSGLVREAVQVVVSPKLSRAIPRQVSSPTAKPLLSQLPDEARSLIRVVQIEKAFRCEYCEDVFYLESGLNDHRVIHKGVKNPFTCHICKVSFATYSRCTTHKTTHGFYKRPLADVKKQAAGSKEPEAGPSSTGILGYGGFPVVKHFLCDDCGRSYLHWTYLQVHRRMKHANDNFLYKCNHCEITFMNSWGLGYHRKKVHGQSGQGEPGDTSKIPREPDHRIPCRDCDEVLPNKIALYKHRKKEHSDMSPLMSFKEESWSSTREKEHDCTTRNKEDEQKLPDGQCRGRSNICPVCSRSFRSASVRDEHLRTHTGERPFPCDLCGISFRRSAAMRNHRLIHTGVRAWACPRCPKRFRMRSDLRTHARLKHPAHLVIIEIKGLDPSPEEVMEHLNANNISNERVIEVTKMSFPKGTTSIIPNCARALAMLGTATRIPVPYNSKPLNSGRALDFELETLTRDTAKSLQQPDIQKLEGATPKLHPIEVAISGGELTDADIQLLLRDGVLLNGNQMVQLQMDETLLQ